MISTHTDISKYYLRIWVPADRYLLILWDCDRVDRHSSLIAFLIKVTILKHYIWWLDFLELMQRVFLAFMRELVI